MSHTLMQVYVREIDHRRLCWFPVTHRSSKTPNLPMTTKPVMFPGQQQMAWCHGPISPFFFFFYISGQINGKNHNERLLSEHVNIQRFNALYSSSFIWKMVAIKPEPQESRGRYTSGADGGSFNGFWPDNLQQVEVSAENVNSLTSVSQLISAE